MFLFYFATKFEFLLIVLCFLFCLFLFADRDIFGENQTERSSTSSFLASLRRSAEKQSTDGMIGSLTTLQP